MTLWNSVWSFSAKHLPFAVSACAAGLLMLFTWLLSAVYEVRLARKRQEISRQTETWDPDLSHMPEHQQKRLWDHAVHEENNFNARLQFFLVFESVLLGAVASLYGKSNINHNALVSLALLGLSVSGFWSYIQARHWYIMKTISPLLAVYLPEYTVSAVARRRWILSSQFLLAYVIPALFVFAWLTVLAIFDGVPLVT